LIAPMTSILSYDTTSICLCDWFSGKNKVIREVGMPQKSHIKGYATYIVFPMSLNSAPGLQMAIAASSASLVVLIKRWESSSISPTG
jgi:hypothetical protein